MISGVVITVIGQDRKGIIAEITSAIADAGGNIEDIRGHTVLLSEGKKIVSLSIVVSGQDPLQLYNDLKDRLDVIKEKMGLKINIYLLGDILQ